jgi:AcrR family transcriptional regulator
MPNTRRKLSEARKAQILSAAVQVICERGLCDTRIADVAVRAGTSSALILYYFESKDRLLAEALAFSEQRFYAETARQLDAIESARDQLIRLIALSCPAGPARVVGWQDGWVLYLDLWARAARDLDVSRDREALDRRWRETIAAIVLRGQERGEFTPVDADDFALRLAVMTDGLAIQVVLGDPDVDAARMFDICVRMAGTELGFEWAGERLPRLAARGGRSAGRRGPIGVARTSRGSAAGAKAGGRSR